jgi:hypothetical protein
MQCKIVGFVSFISPLIVFWPNSSGCWAFFFLAGANYDLVTSLANALAYNQPD